VLAIHKAVATDDLKSLPLCEVEKKLESSPDGLTQTEAQKRLTQYGPNEIEEKKSNELLKFLKLFLGSHPVDDRSGGDTVGRWPGIGLTAPSCPLPMTTSITTIGPRPGTFRWCWGSPRCWVSSGSYRHLAFVYLGERVFHLDRAHVQTMMYLKLSVTGHLTIHSLVDFALMEAFPCKGTPGARHRSSEQHLARSKCGDLYARRAKFHLAERKE
jgi:hypothetical protein